MKHFYIVVCIGGVFLYLCFKSIGFHYLSFEASTIEVSLVYRDTQKSIRLDNYSLLESIIEPLDDPDIDVEKLNLKQVLSHGDVITIPLKTDTPCISINTGTIEELTLLKGIGEKTAQTIITYRQENGLFQTLDELMNVKGIGVKKFEKMVDQLCL